MITSVTSAPAAQVSSERSRLGKNEFLTLLVTQLRNQDPLSPLQPHEFAAQLAQFTSVEQLTQLNEAVVRQADALDLNALIGKTGFAAALIGRRVVAEGNQVTVGATGGGTVRVDIGGNGGRATLIVRDSSGREVATREIGKLRPGRHDLELPSGLDAGTYTYTLKVVDADGKAVPVTSYTIGVVDGVFFKNGSIVLRIGGIEVPLDGVAEIESATSSPSAPSSPPSEADPISIPTGETPVGGGRRGP